MADRVFRITWRNWVAYVILPLAGVAALTGLYLYSPAPLRAKFTLSSICLAAGLYIWVSRGARMWRTKIEVNEEGIVSRTNRECLRFRWSDVIAVWRTTAAKQIFLHLGTSNGTLSIQLQLFNRELAQILDGLVPPESIEERAYEKLPEFQQWRAKRKEIVQDTKGTLRANLTIVTVVGWICVITFPPITALAVIFAARPALTWFALIPGLLSLAGPYFLLSGRPIEVNTEGVAHTAALGRYRIKWDQVTMIEIDPQGQVIVLSGPNNCLPLLGPAWWSGKEKALVTEFFLAQIQEREIPVRETGKALLRSSRNTKMRRPRR